MSLGLDGWATNALQSATEESRRAARIVFGGRHASATWSRRSQESRALLRGFALQSIAKQGRGSELNLASCKTLASIIVDCSIFHAAARTDEFDHTTGIASSPWWKRLRVP